MEFSDQSDDIRKAATSSNDPRIWMDLTYLEAYRIITSIIHLFVSFAITSVRLIQYAEPLIACGPYAT